MLTGPGPGPCLPLRPVGPKRGAGPPSVPARPGLVRLDDSSTFPPPPASVSYFPEEEARVEEFRSFPSPTTTSVPSAPLLTCAAAGSPSSAPAPSRSRYPHPPAAPAPLSSPAGERERLTVRSSPIGSSGRSFDSVACRVLVGVCIPEKRF